MVIVNFGGCINSYPNSDNCKSGVIIVDYTHMDWMEKEKEFHQSALYDAHGKYNLTYRENPYSQYGYTAALSEPHHDWVVEKTRLLIAAAQQPDPTEPSTNQPTKPEPEEEENNGESAGFQFGDDCESGEGAFSQAMDVADRVVTIPGRIPMGKFGVRVQLAAITDLDIVLLDLEDTSEFTEGKALVKWCSKAAKDSGANCGLLGGAKEDSVEYKGMTIEYSGYNGVDDQKGVEWIQISGMTTTTLGMQAYAFKSGLAEITFSWQQGCGGFFTTPVALNAIEEVGTIPQGVKNFEVWLEADVDVDVQLYDLDATQACSESTAIVAYCLEDFGCNCGKITSATHISGAYQGRTYSYSGWNGVDGKKGHEVISIAGVTNRKLRMAVYGYEESTQGAEVYYRYE